MSEKLIVGLGGGRVAKLGERKSFLYAGNMEITPSTCDEPYCPIRRLGVLLAENMHYFSPENESGRQFGDVIVLRTDEVEKRLSEREDEPT